MKPPDLTDQFVKVRAYLTDEDFGYEHWRAAQFSAPNVPSSRYGVLVIFQSEAERDRWLAAAPPALAQDRPQDAALGIGVEAWVELEEIERSGIRYRNNDQSGMSISWRTFMLVMKVLRAIRVEDFRERAAPRPRSGNP